MGAQGEELVYEIITIFGKFMTNFICCVKNGLSICSVSFALLKFKQLKFMDKSVRHVLPRQVMSKVTEFVRTAQNIVDVNKSFEPPQSDGSDQVNVVGDKEDCYPSNDCNCVECSSQNLLSNSETTRRMSGDFSDVYDVSRLFSG